jgi:hypothetical protein
MTNDVTRVEDVQKRSRSHSDSGARMGIFFLRHDLTMSPRLDLNSEIQVIFLLRLPNN